MHALFPTVFIVFFTFDFTRARLEWCSEVETEEIRWEVGLHTQPYSLRLLFSQEEISLQAVAFRLQCVDLQHEGSVTAALIRTETYPSRSAHLFVCQQDYPVYPGFIKYEFKSKELLFGALSSMHRHSAAAFVCVVSSSFFLQSVGEYSSLPGKRKSVSGPVWLMQSVGTVIMASC